MQNKEKRFGIYLNIKQTTLMRISSPYWIPKGEDWVLLTSDVNASLSRARALAVEKGLVTEGESIVWGDWASIGRGLDKV